MTNTNRLLMGLCLLTVVRCQYLVKYKAIDSTSSEMRNELNSRVGVKGAMGGNITLTSASPLGSGKNGFLFLGESGDNTAVAIKFFNDTSVNYDREVKCYTQMEATMNKDCIKYGLPFIYHSDVFLSYKTMAMTLLDTDLYTLHNEIGPFSKETLMIVFRDMIRILKYIHSKGITHQDIKPDNIMLKGANVFVCDFNQCDEIALKNPAHLSSRWFMSIGANLGMPLAGYDDMESLFYTMLWLADVKLPWGKMEAVDQILEAKKRTSVESLCSQLKIPELVEPYTQFYVEVMAASREKRHPKYDSLYKLFDDALYHGRNRSERIVFEWLTTEQKLKAMAEDVPSIESIII